MSGGGAAGVTGAGAWPTNGPYNVGEGAKDLMQDGYYPRKALISKTGIEVKDFNGVRFSKAIPFSRDWDQAPEHRCRNFYVVNYSGKRMGFTSNLTPLLQSTPNTRENTRTLYEWYLDHAETAHHPCMPHNFHISIKDYTFSDRSQQLVGATPSGFDLSNIEQMWINIFVNPYGLIDLLEEKSNQIAQRFAVLFNSSKETIYIKVYEIPVGFANAQEQSSERESLNTFDIGPACSFQVKLLPKEQWNIRVGDFYYTVRAIETTEASHINHPAAIITEVAPIDDFVQGSAIDKVMVGNVLVLFWDKEACRVLWQLYNYDEVKRVNAEMVTNRR